jgi:hypothetical protein
MDVTASAVVAAVQAYSKIKAAGQWIERTEQVSLNDLFERNSVPSGGLNSLTFAESLRAKHLMDISEYNFEHVPLSC